MIIHIDGWNHAWNSTYCSLSETRHDTIGARFYNAKRTRKGEPYADPWNTSRPAFYEIRGRFYHRDIERNYLIYLWMCHLARNPGKTGIIHQANVITLAKRGLYRSWTVGDLPDHIYTASVHSDIALALIASGIKMSTPFVSWFKEEYEDADVNIYQGVEARQAFFAQNRMQRRRPVNRIAPAPIRQHIVG